MLQYITIDFQVGAERGKIQFLFLPAPNYQSFVSFCQFSILYLRRD